MEEHSAAYEYVKRLKRLINSDNDFSFLQYKFVKISRVEDLLTCILAAVPDSYKKALKMKKKSTYRSIVAFYALSKIVRTKFFLFSDYYMVDAGEANNALDAIISSIENDMLNLEELD